MKLGEPSMTSNDLGAFLSDRGALGVTTVAGGVPLVDAVRSAATTPATVLGDPRVGALEVGRRADVVITDSGLRIIEVLRAGMVFHP